MDGNLKLIVGLIALVVLTQIFFFQVKEKKLNNLILGFTQWMHEQEKINNVLTTAVVDVDSELVNKGIFKDSIVSAYIEDKAVKK